MEHRLDISERTLDENLRQQVDIGEMQFGFMPGKRTVDSIFILTQRQGKILEGNGTMYAAFINLEKVHDQMPREVLLPVPREERSVREVSKSCQKSV